MRVVTILFSLLIMFGLGTSADAQQKLKLPFDVEVAVVNTQQPEREDGKKAIKVFITVSNVGGYNEEQRSIISDTFFELYLGPYVEQNEFQVAEVGLGNSIPMEGMGSGMFMTVEFYKYERAENGVWKPGHESVLEKEQIPDARDLTLPSGAVVHVEYQDEAYVNVLQANAFVGAFWSDAPLSDAPRVYSRTREYWLTVKDAVPGSLKVANVVAYDTPKLGRFHFRDAMVITLTREANGGWPELPESWADVEQGKEGLVQASFRAERIRTIWPDY